MIRLLTFWGPAYFQGLLLLVLGSGVFFFCQPANVRMKIFQMIFSKLTPLKTRRVNRKQPVDMILMSP